MAGVKWLALLIACSVLGLCGCGGGFSCSARGRCTNSPNPSSAEIDTCSKDIQDASCGSAFEELLRCFRSDTVCDGQGDEDLAATLQACQAQQSALDACCQQHPDSDACKGATP